VFPDSSHDPITYPFAVTKTGDTPEARAFLNFLSTPAVRDLWVKNGFKVE
jgi:molybdate transport system substrate-binding protein